MRNYQRQLKLITCALLPGLLSNFIGENSKRFSVLNLILFIRTNLHQKLFSFFLNILPEFQLFCIKGNIQNIIGVEKNPCDFDQPKDSSYFEIDNVSAAQNQSPFN